MSGSVCAKAYYQAMKTCLALDSNLKNIFIVDITDQVLSSFNLEFEKLQLEKDVIDKQQSNMYIFRCGAVLELVSAKLHANRAVDAIVSLEDGNMQGPSQIAQDILNLASEDFNQSYKKIVSKGEIGDVRCQETKSHHNLAKFVFHTIVPTWHKQSSITQLENDVYKTMSSILKFGNLFKVKKIAVPLLALNGKLVWLKILKDLHILIPAFYLT